eukprot:TRINITY_DN11136_c0_g1_i1.p1 TRINITY_DN11136_c0_g1~~TRINITY_DN11136_c0_g1_i1.p1  ORF type:complete len:693 (-),score=151.38 TRINITY_DN11136_c0_g1_i1:47-2071(-)
MSETTANDQSIVKLLELVANQLTLKQQPKDEDGSLYSKYIRVNVNYASQTVVVPIKIGSTVQELIGESRSRFKEIHEVSIPEHVYLSTDSARLYHLDRIDKVAQDHDHVSVIDCTPQESHSDRPHAPKKNVGFLTEKREYTICDTKEIHTAVILTSSNIISMLRNVMSDDTLYDEKPVLRLDTLFKALPQLKEKRYGKSNPPTAPQSLKPEVISLIDYLEFEFSDFEKKAKTMLEEGKISYEHLWHVFAKGSQVYGKVNTDFVGGSVTETKYYGGWFPCFSLSISVIKSNGTDFYTDTHKFSVPMFRGVLPLVDLPFQLLTPETKKKLEDRGKLFEKIGKSISYMNYKGNMEWMAWRMTLIKADGRVMVDAASFLRMNPNYREFKLNPSTSNIMNTITEDNLFMTWPTIGGFSFSSKKWGELLVSNLADIKYDDQAFDKLVFPQDRKQLIKSLVENSNKSFTDVISGKGGGCIFLLHGSPGVGKTLTAEAIAEFLRRPLYSVSVGELGTNTEQLEKHLSDILNLAGTWNAVVLIDEADIFLEKRTENDIVRNAMVGIFLRLLEYHQGVLFLTTNRVKCFDSAFHSRISVALKYSDLNEESRKQIWINLMEAAKIDGIDVDKLTKYNLNGRQIRTTLRLAQSLAHSSNEKTSIKHIEQTISVSQQFVDDLLSLDE